MVFGYDGPPWEGPLVGKVLRVRKVNPDRSSAELRPEQDQDQQLELELGFGQGVIAPLLGTDLVLPLTSYAIDSDWLDQLRDFVKRTELAGSDRTAQAEVDPAATRIQLVDNLTFGEDNLAIEIKVRHVPIAPVSRAQAGS